MPMLTRYRTNIVSLAIVLGALFTPALLGAAIPPADSFVSPGDPGCSPSASPPCFTSIQAAVAAADALVNAPSSTLTGYTVMVEPGIYAETITLKSNITLRGRETARTILTGNGSGTLVTASSVSAAEMINFTLMDASIGLLVSGNSSVSILNNIFLLGPAGTGILLQNTLNAAGPEIINNTFIRNATALVRDADIRIINNLFSDNTAIISDATSSLPQDNISFNAFPFPTSGPTGTIFLTTTDPLFVDSDPLKAPPDLDLHLATNSPCINLGTNVFGAGNSIDGRASDIGAYGGPDADTILFPVSGVTVSAPDATTIDISWQPNAGYQTGGYRVWYGKAAGAYTGDASPIVTLEPFLTLSDLSTVITVTLPAPLLAQPEPLDESMRITWSAVPGATGYRVYYSTTSFDQSTLTNVPFVVVDNATSHTLTGLTNGLTYSVAVTAIQADYVIAITAIDIAQIPLTDFVPGKADESAFSVPVTIRAGAPAEGGLSSVLIAMPEAFSAFPGLPRKSGCFIATAVYGSYSAPEVVTLRAFRDRYLMTNRMGRAFVAWYYEQGPRAAAYLQAHPVYKPFVKAVLFPVVAVSRLMTQTPGIITLFAAAVCLLVGGVLARRSSAKNRSDRSAMKRISVLLLVMLMPSAAYADDQAGDAPRWSLELKGGSFTPDIQNWSQHYGGRSMPVFAATLGYKILRQLEVGVEAGSARDTGQAFQPINNISSGNAEYEIQPLNVFVLLRGVMHEEQLLVPYAGGGWTHVLYRTTVQGNQTVRGSADGYHVRGGVQLLLDAMDQGASSVMYRDYRVLHTYFFIEAERTWAKVRSVSVELGGTAYLFGLLFEF